jgi:glycosyltransferase involved in cell wall biosynthesis
MIGKNILGVLILTLISLSVSAQRILNDAYYMVSVDDTKMYRQSNDTLYQYKCSSEFNPFFSIKPVSHYKILSCKLLSVYSILKLEKLDTLQLTTDPYPLTRYQVLVFNKNKDETIGQLMLFRGLTKDALNNVTIPDLSNKFFSTLISSAYKKKLIDLKPVASKQDVDVIIASLKSDKYKEMINRYKMTDLSDMYNSIINSELLYHACVDNGYNPINASNRIGALLKEK